MAQKKKNQNRIRNQEKAIAPSDTPFMMNGTMIVPIHADDDSGMPDSMSPEEFMHQTHKLSDKELNRIMYEQTKLIVKMGKMPEWPKDDFGAFMWFTWNFITPEMREVFPDIAREYLAHEPMIGTEFLNVPYPMMNETTWDDAYYFRVIAIMLTAARRGSSYSRNFLLSLYKVYYKPEYNRLKQLKVLTYLNLLELHDEDCKRKGYSSGHTMDGEKSYRDFVIEERKHEAGWTNVYGARSLSPAPNPSKSMVDHYGDEYSNAADYVKGMTDAPEEPPLQPTAARLFIMCELLHIPIEETCNEMAFHLNKATESMLRLSFTGSEDRRTIWKEMVERNKDFLRAEMPEMFDPYLYQSHEAFLPLEIAENILLDTFKKMDRNVRMPYDSKPFKLADLFADVTVSLQMSFPDVDLRFPDVLYLSMVEYLGECLCEVMMARDNELEDILRFDRRFYKGEWSGVVAAERRDIKADKLLKTVEGMRPEELEPPFPIVEKAPETDEELRAEIDRLKKQLEEKELALAETEQKVILQRALYERESRKSAELEATVEERDVEHSELIALREYVYSIRDDTEVELDEATRDELVKAVQDKNVAILGGNERWAKRMKKLYPKWKFVSVEDDSQGAMNSLESADFIYIYTSALQHKQYYQAMNLIKRKGKMLFYLGSTNTNENIARFYRDLCRK